MTISCRDKISKEIERCAERYLQQVTGLLKGVQDKKRSAEHDEYLTRLGVKVVYHDMTTVVID
jgi:hypothetical protein